MATWQADSMCGKNDCLFAGGYVFGGAERGRDGRVYVGKILGTGIDAGKVGTYMRRRSNYGAFYTSGFTGGALAITCKTDYIICDGECKGIFEEPARIIWKNANFAPYLHPDASHNLNFNFNAMGAYGVITNFLSAKGL